MNKKYLTKTIVYFVLALVVMPAIWFFSTNLVWLFFTQSVENIYKVVQIVRYLHIGFGVLGLVFLGLGVYYLIKLLGDEENNKERRD